MKDNSVNIMNNVTKFDPNIVGFSEAYYVLWNDPQNNISMVVRYVLFNGPTDETKIAEVWGWFRDKNYSVDVAIRQRYPLKFAEFSKDQFSLKIANSGITQNKCWGKIFSDTDRVSWEFDLSDEGAIGINRFPDTEKYEFFPKFYSPYCKHKLSGKVQVNEREYYLENLNGTDGHYWNPHAVKTWNWGNCVNFADDPDFLFEGIGIKINDCLQPTVSMFFQWDGKLYQSDVVDSIFKNKEIQSELNYWKFSAELEDVLFEGEINADPEDMILLLHPLLDGTFLYTTITLSANITIDISKKSNNAWEKVKTLTAQNAAAFEVTKPVRNEQVKREFKIVPVND